MREYCCTALWQSKSVGSFVLGAFPASNARFARDEPSSKRVGGVVLWPRAAKATFVALRFGRGPPKLRLWRCTQPRAAKATAGVAVVGKIESIRRAAVVV